MSSNRLHSFHMRLQRTTDEIHVCDGAVDAWWVIKAVVVETADVRN